MRKSKECLMHVIWQSGYGKCFRHCRKVLCHLTFNTWTMEKQGICVKVSDISDALNIPRPGVTRTVKEMETKGYLQKLSSPDDGRVTFITLTEAGKALSRKYNEHYFNELSSYLDDISEEDADCMIRTIGKFYEIMSERREHYEK